MSVKYFLVVIIIVITFNRDDGYNAAIINSHVSMNRIRTTDISSMTWAEIKTTLYQRVQ